MQKSNEAANGCSTKGKWQRETLLLCSELLDHRRLDEEHRTIPHRCGADMSLAVARRIAALRQQTQDSFALVPKWDYDVTHANTLTTDHQIVLRAADLRGR
jgi:hypothetical protein